MPHVKIILEPIALTCVVLGLITSERAVFAAGPTTVQSTRNNASKMQTSLQQA